MNRRDFLLASLGGSMMAAAPGVLLPADARAQATTASSPIRLNVVSRTLDVGGKAAKVFGLLQPNGHHGLILKAGEAFDVTLANKLDEGTLIHWHGLTPPWEQDGVPDNPAALLKLLEERRYQFSAGPGGTHWMHAHTLQEQNLLAAPLIVRTAEDERRDEQEVVILLHDFSFTPAEELLAKLRAGTAAPSMNHGMMGHGSEGMSGMAGMMPGGGHSMSMPGMSHGRSSEVEMSRADLNDIDYDAYLANDRTLDDPEIVTVEKHGRVRLRIINGATSTGFTIDLGALDGELVAVDGQAVRPLKGRRFPISMGQRLDIRLNLTASGGTFPILALREGAVERTGIILASTGAAVAKLTSKGTDRGPVLSLALEEALSATEPLAIRKPDLKYELVLSGDMAGYKWSIDGAEGLKTRRNQRVEITLRNMSMMAHPMHLHGHHFQVGAVNGRTIRGAVRDTVLIPPMATVSIAFDTDNPGKWPLHCHHLFHMAAGMMAYLSYAPTT